MEYHVLFCNKSYESTWDGAYINDALVDDYFKYPALCTLSTGMTLP